MRNVSRLKTYRGFPYDFRKHPEEDRKTYHIYTKTGKLLFCHDRTCVDAYRTIDHLVNEQIDAERIQR